MQQVIQKYSRIIRDKVRQINATSSVKDRSFAVGLGWGKGDNHKSHGWVSSFLLKWCKHCSLTSDVKCYCCIKAWHSAREYTDFGMILWLLIHWSYQCVCVFCNIRLGFYSMRTLLKHAQFQRYLHHKQQHFAQITELLKHSGKQKTDIILPSGWLWNSYKEKELKVLSDIDVL